MKAEQFINHSRVKYYDLPPDYGKLGTTRPMEILLKSRY